MLGLLAWVVLIEQHGNGNRTQGTSEAPTACRTLPHAIPHIPTPDAQVSRFINDVATVQSSRDDFKRARRPVDCRMFDFALWKTSVSHFAGNPKRRFEFGSRSR